MVQGCDKTVEGMASGRQEAIATELRGKGQARVPRKQQKHCSGADRQEERGMAARMRIAAGAQAILRAEWYSRRCKRFRKLMAVGSRVPDYQPKSSSKNGGSRGRKLEAAAGAINRDSLPGRPQSGAAGACDAAEVAAPTSVVTRGQGNRNGGRKRRSRGFASRSKEGKVLPRSLQSRAGRKRRSGAVVVNTSCAEEARDSGFALTRRDSDVGLLLLGKAGDPSRIRAEGRGNGNGLQQPLKALAAHHRPEKEVLSRHHGCRPEECHVTARREAGEDGKKDGNSGPQP
ncbi:hypothetical protein FB451DRAFT_1465766 [Mycena latifolia]|nr:hypothetical protein FB451DRAFT_1465766 [Mycena latifolia]